MNKKLCAATMEIGGKVRRIEEREDGLWYLASPADQAELGSQGKPYLEWYEQSDFIRNWSKSTMCYS
jgi:hypothetical protein